MSELPAGWSQARIIDLADINPKQAFDDDLIAGFVPMSHAPTNFLDKLRFEQRPWGEIKKAYTNFKDGDVIFAKVTPCFENGKAAFVEGLPNNIGAGSSEFYVLRPASDEISAKYLLALVKTRDFLSSGAENMTGAVGLRRVPKSFVENYLILVPPAAEQTRIAQKLDELLAQIDTLKARIDGIPALLKRFRQSVLAAAVSGRLTISKSTLEDPIDWQELPFASVINDLRYGTAKKCDYNIGDTGVLRIPNIGENGITLDDLKSSNFTEQEKLKLSLRKDDIILIRSNGSVDLVGKPALVTHKEEGLLFAGYLIRIRLKTDQAVPQYINYWLKSPITRQIIELMARSTSGVNNINSEEIKSLSLKLPPLEQQTEIVRRVEQLFAFADQLETKVTAAQSRIDQLTQSILAKAFRGELVPQDPNDEPASVLLERIKAQRAAAPKAKRSRKASA
ncbi:restriction endonuclease subunit S [Pseudomonas sp. 5P_3.1_Bac2]|uniref:restriction endonuclease subunit S n=1 Tax=Pseudomonas sp. 5P_3.1_Bac2 TaxID=2971617 RepID=UPI0021C736D2|nr:restriction endonuclease subunit S [Pseudomonas sp. 5P_3.1_Bac2]MCU1718180.1 restriction endonuclease subunit S [Pseudomonas sp. 5P_3.1_Bac2]